MAPSSPAEAAEFYASEYGWAVFPVNRKKKPATEHGFKDAVNDPDAVREMWGRYPGCGVAVSNGSPSGGLVVLDLDTHGAKDGRAELDAWLERTGNELPDTVEDRTPSGGAHIFFRANADVPKRTMDVLEGIDVCGGGGYTVLSPSENEEGRYEWLEGRAPWEFEIAPMPAWVHDLVAEKKKREARTDKSDEPAGTARKGRFKLPKTIKEGRRNETLAAYAGQLYARGNDADEVCRLVRIANAERCRPPLPSEEVARICESIGSRAEGDKRRKAPTVNDMVAYIRSVEDYDGLAYDTMAQYPCAKKALPWDSRAPRPLEKIDYTHMFAELQECYRANNDKHVRAAVDIVVHDKEFNPVVDMLEQLPAWDGEERAGLVFSTFLGVADTWLSREVTELFMRAAVARVHTPGVKFDHMLVLFSETQGIGKSSLLKALAMNGDYYTDGLRKFNDSKIAGEIVRGRWIVEIPELAGFSPNTLNLIKAYVTSDSDTYREAYGVGAAKSYPRTCVLAGTTNKRGFLIDQTGERRFVPLVCMEAAPRLSFWSEDGRGYIAQAWAEALAKYRAKPGEPLTLSERANIALEDVRDGFRGEPSWMGDLREFLAKVAEVGDGNRCYRVNVRMVMAKVFDIGNAEAARNRELEDDVRDALDTMPGWRRMRGKQAARYQGTSYGTAIAWEYWPFGSGKSTANAAPQVEGIA